MCHVCAASRTICAPPVRATAHPPCPPPRRRAPAPACPRGARPVSGAARRAPRASPSAVPISQQTTDTPESAGTIVASRSGSATIPSTPAASTSASALRRARRPPHRVLRPGAPRQARAPAPAADDEDARHAASRRCPPGCVPPAARRRSSSRQRWSAATWARMSASVISGRPVARRRAFWASIIWSTSSSSSSASTSGERVGRQSTCSAPEPGYQRADRQEDPDQRPAPPNTTKAANSSTRARVYAPARCLKP